MNMDCKCGHPHDTHDFADDEPGPCYDTASPDDPEGDCPCDTFTPRDP